MKTISSTIILATTLGACSAADDTDIGSSAMALGGVRVASGDVDGDGLADEPPEACSEGGLTFDANGNPSTCYRGGVNVAVGDINNDGTADVITLVIASRSRLPRLVVGAANGGVWKTTNGGLGAEGTAVTIATSSSGVEDVQVPDDCEGVSIDRRTGDVLDCGEAIGLLLPAVQKYGDEEPAAGLLLPAIQKYGSGDQANGSAASGGAGGAGKVKFDRLTFFSRNGTPVTVEIVAEGGHVDTTHRDLGVLRGAASLAAKAKADILIESLEE